MRIVKPSRLAEFWARHARARSSLENWHAVAKASTWKEFADVRKTFRSADEVRAASGRAVVVFNVGGNAYRLICALHYDRAKLFVLRFLTHAEYDKDTWKNEL